VRRQVLAAFPGSRAPIDSAQLAGSFPEARGSMTAATVEGSLGALSGQIGIDPQDPVEGMLSAQMMPRTPPLLTSTVGSGSRNRASK
jgi:hypothetical protein